MKLKTTIAALLATVSLSSAEVDFTFTPMLLIEAGVMQAVKEDAPVGEFYLEKMEAGFDLNVN